jgi:hypothetical protein
MPTSIEKPIRPSMNTPIVKNINLIDLNGCRIKYPKANPITNMRIKTSISAGEVQLLDIVKVLNLSSYF